MRSTLCSRCPSIRHDTKLSFRCTGPLVTRIQKREDFPLKVHTKGSSASQMHTHTRDALCRGCTRTQRKLCVADAHAHKGCSVSRMHTHTRDALCRGCTRTERMLCTRTQHSRNLRKSIFRRTGSEFAPCRGQRKIGAEK